MRRSSSTSHFDRPPPFIPPPLPETATGEGEGGGRVGHRVNLRSLLIALCLTLACSPAPADARPWLCLPPIFDGGQRLHGLPPRVFWLELLLRQHELCWRAQPDPSEVRIALVGNSAVYGFPNAAGETLAGFLNMHFVTRHVPAHVFNLASVLTYQLRDAVVIHEASRYEPDVLLYPLTLSDFMHVAPAEFPVLTEFFASNKHSLYALAQNPPPGLVEPLAAYRALLERQGPRNGPLYRLREIGALLRVAAQQHAEALAFTLTSIPPQPFKTSKHRKAQYNCKKTEESMMTDFQNWSTWSVLGYVAQLQQQGLRVVVVNWPITHEPVDRCYNYRYTNAAVAEFNQQLAAETQARELPYVDLHDFLPPDDFVDSLHVSPAGQHKIAERLAEVLDPLVGEIADRKARVTAQRASQ